MLFASPRKIESPFVHIYVAYRDYFQSADNLLICTAPFIGFNIYVLQITLASNELVSLVAPMIWFAANAMGGNKTHDQQKGMRSLSRLLHKLLPFFVHFSHCCQTRYTSELIPPSSFFKTTFRRISIKQREPKRLSRLADQLRGCYKVAKFLCKDKGT